MQLSTEHVTGAWGATALLLGSVLGAALSNLVTITVLLRLPQDAFTKPRSDWPSSFPGVLLRIGTNVLGWGIIVAGLVLTIPGVPGQGLLTIATGLLLIDLPGRRALLRKLVERPGVRSALNALRGRFGRPPFTG